MMYSSRPSAHRALNRRSIEKIRGKVEKMAGKNVLVKFFTAGNDKGKIAGWRSELNDILRVFNVC